MTRLSRKWALATLWACAAFLPALPLQAWSAGFDAARYNPAVLRIGFSEAGAAGKGSIVSNSATPTSAATTSGANTSAANTSGANTVFLDLTLIPAEGEVQGFRSEVSLKRFNELLRQLYSQLARQSALEVNDPASASRQLYGLLIKPVAPELERQGITTLLLSADAGLQALPYAALHDGTSFLGQRYGLGLTPALGLTRLDAVAERSKARALGAGASEFQALSPLPLVPQELERQSLVAPGDRYLNRAFTPSVLLEKAGDNTVQRVHVATHAEFLPGGPAAARLFTGTDSIGLRQLSELRQRRGNSQMDLFTLSACRTALGDADTELGFAGLALQAGSRSAIGSLWYVDDVATSALFVQFYRYLDQGIPKADALLLTRQAMVTGRMRLVGEQVLGADDQVLLSKLTPAQQRRISGGLQHPFFWSGIQLLGNPW